MTGGRTFGYKNVDVMSGRVDVHGRPIRSHVERQVNDTEAAVVRTIFDLCALGSGKAAIAKRLNDEGAAHPHPQQGRPGGWCPSSVREVLYRDTYRGVIVWNKTRKRDEDGRAAVRDRPESEWMRVEAPQLRIVTDAQWKAAHERLASTRASSLRSNSGKLWGRPLSGTAAKYLGTGLLQCGCCGGTLEVRSIARRASRGTR